MPLNFVIFSFLFLFCYFKSGLVKLTWVNLHFLSHCFLFNSDLFLLGPSFRIIFFFIMISCRGWQVSRVNSGWLIFFFLNFLWSFLFQFHYFTLNYFFSSFVIFSLFFLFVYSENGLWVYQVTLSWVGFFSSALYFWIFFCFHL